MAPESAPDCVLVTGASRGIALRLAQDGYGVALHYNSAELAARAVATEIAAMGRPARLLQFDVAQRASTAAALKADIEDHGAYYGVVSNAGIADDETFVALKPEQWDRVIHTNLDSFYNVLSPLVMPMVQRRRPGRIVTIASVSGLVGNRGQTNYSAAKAGLMGASKALALELAKRRITVNCVAPGLIDTEMLPESVRTPEVMRMIPAERLGKPEEVAGLVSFLMSEAAGYITRQVISVNGGMV